MKTMKKEQAVTPVGLSGRLLVASLFILSGILLFARHLGWITPELFSLLVAWHSLLILLGLYALIRRHFLRGAILLLLGAYILLGRFSCLPENTQALVWPVALILTGIFFFVKTRRGTFGRMRPERRGPESFEERRTTGDGFLYSESSFRGVRHVILDDIFKGAFIHTVFGGIIVDLRHTHLAPGETHIDVDCTCGGIQLLIPSDWKVIFDCDAFLGGCDDKRWHNGSVNKESTLIIRGKLSFGGVEIKE